MRNNEELKISHASGFGGSDAKMFLKIGCRGIESLSTTETKRVLVALGKIKPETFEGNVYTEAGHLFEDYYANETYSIAKGMEREKYIEAKGMARNFKIFAHADFYDDITNAVVECKYSQDDTTKVCGRYLPQLQWYYMLGADNVTLVHGFGKVLPFDVEGIMTVDVNRDDEYIYWLRHGIALLDKAIDDGMFDDYDVTTVTVADMDEETAVACRALGVVIARMKETEQLAEQHKATLLAWMEQHGVLNIKGDGFTVSYVSPHTSKTFDTKKAQADFPTLKDAKYYKLSNVKSSVKITLK